MVNIKIIDTGATRYSIENDTVFFGRRYDDGAEFITVEKPEAEQDSVCLLLVATLEGKIIDQFTVTDEPIAITSNLSQYPSLKIGFSFLRPDDSVKNSEPKQIFFLSAIKPSDFKPAPSQKEPLYELLTKAFAKVVYVGKNLSFYNIFDDKVATVEIAGGGAQKQSDLAETDSTSETFVKGKKTSNLANDGDGESPFATQNYADKKISAIKTEVQTAQKTAENAQTTIDAHKKDSANPHKVTKAQIGLGNVNNTADSEKPVSTPQQTELDKKLDKTGGAISGNLSISGDLVVNGTEKVNNVENLNVKDQMIYANSNGASLAGNAGLGIKKNAVDIYGIVYDETDDAVKLGLGTADENGKFTFNDGEGFAVAARSDSATFTNDHLVKWDAEKKKLVDSGNTATNFVKKSGDTIDGDLSVTGKLLVAGDDIHSELYENVVPQINAIENDVAGIDPRLSTAENDITSLDQQVAAAEQAAQDAQTNIATHKANMANPHGVTKSQVGLGNVDNTADKNKPVSTAQQTAIDAKLDKPTNVGTSGQVLTKTADGSEWKDNDGNIVIKKTISALPASGASIIIDFTTEEQNIIKTTPEKVVLELSTSTTTTVLQATSISSSSVYFSTPVRALTYYYMTYTISSGKGQLGRYDIETGGGETYVFFTSTVDEAITLSSNDLNELTDESNDNVIIIEYDANADDTTIYRRCAVFGNSYWFVSIYTESAIPPDTSDAFKMAVKARQIDKTNSTLSERFVSGLATSSQLSNVNKNARKYEHRILSRVMLKGNMYNVEAKIITSDANAYTTTVPTRLANGYPCVVTSTLGNSNASNVMAGYYSTDSKIQLRGVLVEFDGSSAVVTGDTEFTMITFIASDTVTQI